MKGYIYSAQIPMFGHKDIIGYGTDEFCVKEIEKDVANKIIIDNHYSKKVYNATYIHLGVFIENKLLGVLQYGYAMNPASCGSVVEGTEMNQYLELNRMWLDDMAKKNSESMAISYSIKYIKGKLKIIKWIQSFADERCGGLGIVYQACSFRYYGEHTSSFWELENTMYHNTSMTVSKKSERYKNNVGGCRYLQTNKEEATKHDLRQFRYIKFLDKSWVKKCNHKEQPYLKHYNND
jgi:adenine modification enzyme